VPRAALPLMASFYPIGSGTNQSAQGHCVPRRSHAHSAIGHARIRWDARGWKTRTRSVPSWGASREQPHNSLTVDNGPVGGHVFCLDHPGPCDIVAFITTDTSSAPPRVSVLTATFEAPEAHLLAAYSSLLHGNSDVPWEWIIQIDGLGAHVPVALRDEPRISLGANGAHLGPAATRNLALTRVRSQFVQNLDSDDCLLPGTLRALSTALEAHHDAALAFGRDVELLLRPSK
jgi:hypothetical protein